MQINPKPPHARVDFQVHGKPPRQVQRLDLVQMVHVQQRNRQFEFRHRQEVLSVHAREHEHRVANPSRAEFRSFIDGCHTEPIRPRCCELGRNQHSTVPVTVGFYHSQQARFACQAAA